ncbi:putative pentatricopeptide repeat-containing protein At5g06400, mitochondrial [Arachis duranensis]|uniref:Pentatricopeptide repeat-containing protein At5g06400, mitochondrial n=1 Tax=Arachis duranensis TaxID=130453 RepID=A0A6P5N5A6_ARADU|nr:putative pentatricopeptide repeat-containing protein At5g06400, mitochondrial [Arachis duranensis]XP_025661744.1 putative pentatricopeptide repeat-containing protein At5g06400, mitochondrial [Arachis hypogaea]
MVLSAVCDLHGAMRSISKLQILNQPLSYLLSLPQVLHFSSSSSNSSKHSPLLSRAATQQSDPGIYRALFDEITDILGAGPVVQDNSSSGFLFLEEADKGKSDSEVEHDCTKDVCGNATASVLLDKGKSFGVFRDSKLGNMSEDDVSRVVGEITRIFRGEKDWSPVEEKLENLNFGLRAEVFDMVLKRCFKVPHLALRAFDWVKNKEGFSHTMKTYNTMLWIAGQAKEFGVVNKLVEEMDDCGIEKDVRTWTILISHYGKVKQISKLLLAFENMKKFGCEPDEVAYRAMIRSLCSCGKGDIAMEFYKDMVQKDMVLDLRLYKLLMNSMARAADVAAVRFLGNDMTRLSLMPENSVQSCMLKSFCISGRIKEALELIRDLKSKDLAIEPEFFETLVRGLCKAGMITDALEIVEIMKRRDIVDGRIHGIIINGYLGRNEVHKAIDMFQSMKESGCVPTISTYTELIQHLFKLNRYEDACLLYEEMLGKGIKPDRVVITAMVAGHVSQNRIFEAWKLFKSMECQGIKPNWKPYALFIKELCKASRTDDIIKVLYDMQATEIVVLDEVFHCVVTYLKNKGELDMKAKVEKIYTAFKLDLQKCSKSEEQVSLRIKVEKDVVIDQSESQKVNHSSVHPHDKTYNEQDVHEICRILSSSMDWSLIQENLERSTIRFTPEFVLEILQHCSMHGNTMLKFFSWVGKQPGYRHTVETYNMAIKIAGRGKDFKHMRSLFFEMRRNNYSIMSETWTIMIMLYGRIGLTDLAMNCFREMKAEGYKPSRSTYKYLIIALCGRKGRKVDEAIKIYGEMIRARHIPDKELVETFLGCLCEVGRLSEARRCTDSLKIFGYSVPLSYSLLIRALCRVGKMEEALALVGESGAEKPTLDQFTCGSIVHGLLRKGQFEDALAKVESMKQKGIKPTIHVYTSLIVHYFKEKQIGKAIEVFKEMQESGYEPNIVTYSALISGYMNMERPTDAWNIFYRMKLKGPSPDFKTYSMFLSCLCKSGRSEEAMKLISEMLDSGIVPSTINFRTVFFGLNREGKHDLAQLVLQQKSELIRMRKLIT